MAQQDRIRLIRDLEKLRGSRVIAYVTSDRPPPFEAQMAMDVVRPFYAHLSALGHCSKLDVFLFSVGGDTMVPWRLANLIREYCDSFGVLIPYKAHSAATMLALGANEIVMGPLGELSPIDSSVRTPFNPPNSDQPNEPKTPISVEDVMGFFNLARERIGIADQDNLITALGHLAAKVHPLAIGSIYRSHALTRLLALTRGVGESPSLLDEAVPGNDLSRVTSEEFATSDVARVASAQTREVVEELRTADLVAQTLVLDRATLESLATSDAADRLLTLERATSEALSVSVVATRNLTLGRFVAEAPSTADSAVAKAAGATIDATVSEALSVSDDADRLALLIRGVSDASTTSDIATAAITRAFHPRSQIIIISS